MENVNWKKNIALYLAGQATTLIGSSLVGFAIMWYVTLKTQSGAVMTLFTVATLLPLFFISPFGGVWADRFNRKYLINIADSAIAVVTLFVAILFSFGVDNTALLFVCAIIRSFGQGVQMPATGALLPQLVPEEHLMRINGLHSSIQSVSMLASPTAAGALLTFAPLQIVLFIDVVTAIIGISILFFFVKVPEKTAEEKAEAAARGYFRGMKEGVSYIGRHKFIKQFFLCAASYSVLLAPAALLTPLQVTRDFGGDVWRLTAIELVFSVGMLVGGIIISAWGGFKNKTVTLAIGSLLFGLEGIGLGVLDNFPLYLTCMVIMGFTVPVINTPVMAILQAKVDSDYMGRVFGVMTMVTSIGMPAGMVIFGPLGDVIAIDYLLIVTGIGTLFLGLYVFLNRTLMEAGR